MLLKVVLTGFFSYLTVTSYDAGRIFPAIAFAVLALAFFCTITHK